MFLLHNDINDALHRFFEALYTSHVDTAPEVMHECLRKCGLPNLTQTERDSLDAEITSKDIITAMPLWITCLCSEPDLFVKYPLCLRFLYDL